MAKPLSVDSGRDLEQISRDRDRTWTSARAERGVQRRASRRGADAASVAGVRLTHPERVVFARSGQTKEDVARYYERIAPRILPHLEGRPLTLVRCPEGAGRECFFVKHAGAWAPRALRRVSIQEKTKRADYLTVDSVEGLVGLVQMNVLELHTWNARADDLERPDRIVFDLDPGPGVAWARVAAAAAILRERLERMDLASFVKTTGGKGAHVVVPLRPRASWAECLDFSRGVSEGLEREQPDAFLTAMAKAKRPGRILIDYARNHRGSTSVSAFSTRSRPTAPVSMPVSWDELPALAGGGAVVLADVERRLRDRGKDPWAGYEAVRQTLTAARLKKAQGL